MMVETTGNRAVNIHWHPATDETLRSEIGMSWNLSSLLQPINLLVSRYLLSWRRTFLVRQPYMHLFPRAAIREEDDPLYTWFFNGCDRGGNCNGCTDISICVTNCHLVVVSISASHVCTCPTASFTMLADILTTCHLLARCTTQNSAVSLRFIDSKGALPVHPHLHRQNLMLWFSSWKHGQKLSTIQVPPNFQLEKIQPIISSPHNQQCHKKIGRFYHIQWR